MGISLNSKGTYFPPLWKAPFYGAYYGTKDSLVWVGQVWNGLTGIAKDATQGKVSKDVSGPVGILAIIDRILKTGNIWDLINLIGIISVNLAVLNISIPALDGGRLFFIVIGCVWQKVAPKIESVIHGVGMVILLAAMLLITFKDVRGLISAGSISGFLDNMTSK
jgi:regulator of sigma E protease